MEGTGAKQCLPTAKKQNQKLKKKSRKGKKEDDKPEENNSAILGWLEHKDLCTPLSYSRGTKRQKLHQRLSSSETDISDLGIMGDKGEGSLILHAINTLGEKFEKSVGVAIELLSKKQVADSARIDDIESSLENAYCEIDDLKTVNLKLTGKLCMAEARIMRLEKKFAEVQERVIQQESRSMRDNLVFNNLPEVDKETPQILRGMIYDFVDNEMKVENAYNLPIDRIHRLGSKGTNPRPVIAKFLTTAGKEAVQKKGANLRGTTYGVSEQYPKEIEERRKTLRSIVKDARVNNADVKTRISVDKLWINGDLYRSHQDDEKGRYIFHPEDAEAANDIELKTTEQIVDKGSTFQAYVGKINGVQQVKPTILKMFQDSNVTASATHITYAYRVKAEDGTIRQSWSDDGEEGAGRKIADILQEKEADGVMVIIPRWSGGQHLGKARYDHYKRCTTMALDKFGM